MSLNIYSALIDKLTSVPAILLYVAILFLILLILIFYAISSSNRAKIEEQEDDKNKYMQAINSLKNDLKANMDIELAKLNKELMLQNSKLDILATKTNVIPTIISKDINIEKINTTSDTIVSNEDNNINEIENSSNESRFYMLTEIDKYYQTYNPPIYDNTISLERLCIDFREYSAYKLKLYYDIKDIRRFIAGLAVTHLLILQGMSGTGKTSLAYAFGEFLNNKTVVVPIQPMWKERTDLIGYYNEFTKKFNETTLLYKMYEANNNKEIFITVLDEMNIARVGYYFAEFLSLLELPNPEGRNLDVVSDTWENDPKLLNNGKLRLPINMWFIGTANNDDSTFAISDKVYDRAMVLNLDQKANVFEGKKIEDYKISIDHLLNLFSEAQNKYDLTQKSLNRIKRLDKFLIDNFQITFGNRIMKQIQSYVPVVVACGGDELEALDDILSRKVLRKLESKNPVYVKSKSEALLSTIDEIFGENKMPLCKEAIRHIEQNV